MRLTNTLYVMDHRAHIRLRKGTLIVQQGPEWQRVPIETIDGVVLTGRAEITNDAIGELVRRGVRIAAVSKTGKLRFWIGGPVGGNVHLRVAQHQASSDDARSNEISRCIVAGKLQNCRRAIQRWSWAGEGLDREVLNSEFESIGQCIRSLVDASTGDQIRGIEGDGSRRYFKCVKIHLASGDQPILFEQRTRRPPRDRANALLSFAYALLTVELVGSLDAVGLDPQIGFLHRPRSGRPSLALDLLEEFRPSVADRFAVNLLRRRQLGDEHFDEVGGACYLSVAGREEFLGQWEKYRSEEVDHIILERQVGRWALPTVQATLLARFLRGDLPVYPPFLTSL